MLYCYNVTLYLQVITTFVIPRNCFVSKMTTPNQSVEEFYLQLSENPIRFDAVSQLTNVFFDDTNGQVIIVLYFYMLISLLRS